MDSSCVGKGDNRALTRRAAGDVSDNGRGRKKKLRKLDRTSRPFYFFLCTRIGLSTRF